MPYPVTIKFTGRRAGVTGRPRPGDRFEQTETIPAVHPGSGPLAVTTRVRGVTAGEWQVRATPAVVQRHRPPLRPLVEPHQAGRLSPTRVLWSKGNPVASTGPGVRATTRVAVLATAPGIIPASWSALVATGVVVALTLRGVLIARVHEPVSPALAVAIASSVAGAIGARLWYVALQRGRAGGGVSRGLCIQGFVTGVVIVGLLALTLTRIPAGTFLDAAAPGLFFAMAIGRQGCFFTGCCTGRPTASRWGVWSSDGRIGVRRVPVQQLEAFACLLIGAGALIAVVRLGESAGGAVFIGAAAVYTIVRQGLLALRDEPRRTSLGRPIAIAVAALVLLVDIIVSYTL